MREIAVAIAASGMVLALAVALTVSSSEDDPARLAPQHRVHGPFKRA